MAENVLHGADHENSTAAASARNTFTVRRLAPGDIDWVLRLESEVYAQPWPREAFLRELESEDSVFFIGAEGDRRVGYASLHKHGRRAHVNTVTVSPDYRLRRAGLRLMVALLEEAVRSSVSVVRLEVEITNRAARALYERLGFKRIAVRARYYNGTDALVMELAEMSSVAFREALERIAQELWTPESSKA
jgi:ribosomal-protein-alanine N-acetyltransferase